MENQANNQITFKSPVELTPEPLKINLLVDFIQANFEEIINNLSSKYFEDFELTPSWFNFHVDQRFDNRSKMYEVNWTIHLGRADKLKPEFFRTGSLKIFGGYATTIEEAINKIADSYMPKPTIEEVSDANNDGQ